MDNFKNRVRMSLLALALIAGTTACDLSEDLTDCTVDMQLKFRFTDGGGSEAFGPQVPSLSVFVFDGQGLFVGRWDEADNSKFGADYSMTLPLPPGTYSFVVWGGLLEDHYGLAHEGENYGEGTDPVVGRSHIDDVVVRLAGDYEQVVDFIPSGKFHGEAANRTVTVGTDNEIVIDLVKNNNEIRLTILGLPLPITRANPYTQMSMWLSAANGGYDFHNSVEQDSAVMTYRPQGVDGGENGALVASFHTLRLQLLDNNYAHTEYTYTLWSREIASPYLVADLLHDYIFQTEGGRYNTQEKIDAEDLFDIVIDLGGYAPDPVSGANVGVKVTVNDYKVNTTGSGIQ